jgi:hypothetical protein
MEILLHKKEPVQLCFILIRVKKGFTCCFLQYFILITSVCISRFGSKGGLEGWELQRWRYKSGAKHTTVKTLGHRAAQTQQDQ